MKEKTTIVIPNLNGMKYLKECLDSLCLPGNESLILMIDNGSTDESVSFVKEYYPQVTIYSFPENQGFCKAVNRGIQKARTPYVLLLNNDTRVMPYFVENLENRMEQDKKCFSVSACMLMLQDKDRIDDAGDSYCCLGFAYARFKGQNKSRAWKSCSVFASCAGAALYRREVFDKIGFFDENHFAYLEDIDIGYRAKIFGYRNLYEPKAEVLHAGSASSGSRYNAFKTRLSSQNSIYLIYKNMPVFQIVLNAPFLLLGFFIKTLFFLKKGFGKLYVQGLWKGVLLSGSESGKAHKVPFKWKHLGNYSRIQLALWGNLLRKLLIEN